MVSNITIIYTKGIRSLVSINDPDQHVDQYSVDITLTLDQHVAQDFINTRPTFSP